MLTYRGGVRVPGALHPLLARLVQFYGVVVGQFYGAVLRCGAVLHS